MHPLPLSKTFMLLEPGPVILVSTNSGRKNNIMTISWHMVLDFTPRFAFMTGPWNHSFKALMKNKECVIAIPTVDIAETIVKIGACSGSSTDKFKEFGLTSLKAKSVKAPLIKECLANIECRVIDYVEQHSIFVLDAVHAWIDPDRGECRTIHAKGDGTFIVDGPVLDYRELMLSKIPEGV